MKKEQIAQINIMTWIEYNYPDIFQDTYHFANERKCSMIQGRLLKRMGVKRGVSDIFIAIPSRGFSGLWIELKVEDGRMSKEQKEFVSRMKKRGYEAECVWGEEEAKKLIMEYLDLKE